MFLNFKLDLFQYRRDPPETTTDSGGRFLGWNILLKYLLRFLERGNAYSGSIVSTCTPFAVLVKDTKSLPRGVTIDPLA